MSIKDFLTKCNYGKSHDISILITAFVNSPSNLEEKEKRFILLPNLITLDRTTFYFILNKTHTASSETELKFSSGRLVK